MFLVATTKPDLYLPGVLGARRRRCGACGDRVVALPRPARVRGKPPMTKPRRLRVIRRRHRYMMSLSAPLDADVLGPDLED